MHHLIIRRFVFLAVIMVSFAQASALAGDLNLSRLKLGTTVKDLKSFFPTEFICKPGDIDKSEDFCQLENCGVTDRKCKLWGNQALAFVKSSAHYQKKKLMKIEVDLDYSELQPKDARNILSGLMKELGLPTECPLQSTLEDPEKKKMDFQCIWKRKGAKIELEWDAGRPIVTLEVNHKQ